MSLFDEILAGSIDMHVHNGPDASFERRSDALQLAKSGQQLGMRGMVIKNRNYSTCALADLVNQLIPDCRLFGSLCLDYEIGGLNVFGVEAAAKLGARVIWMPTLSAANSRGKVSKRLPTPLRGAGINILDEDHLKSVKEILEIIIDHNMILATGHVSPREVFALVAQSEKIGLKKIIITHPLSDGAVDQSLTLDEQKGLAARGAIIEHCFLDVMPPTCEIKCDSMAQAIKAVGAEHCIMSTDFGQVQNPPAPEGLRLFIASMLKCGLSRSEIEIMVKRNPARLLELG
jgi:hypothetical protein